jgi:hypothetical protein
MTVSPKNPIKITYKTDRSSIISVYAIDVWHVSYHFAKIREYKLKEDEYCIIDLTTEEKIGNLDVTIR